MFDFNSMFDFGIGDFCRAPPLGYVNQVPHFVRPNFVAIGLIVNILGVFLS